MTDFRKLFDLTGKTAVVLGAARGSAIVGSCACCTWRRVCAPISVNGRRATAAAIREQGGQADAEL